MPLTKDKKIPLKECLTIVKEKKFGYQGEFWTPFKNKILNDVAKLKKKEEVKDETEEEGKET